MSERELSNRPLLRPWTATSPPHSTSTSFEANRRFAYPPLESIDGGNDLCSAAGLSKGAFFHHFASKEELAIAAVDHWSVTTSRRFADAEYHEHADPADRVLGYLDFRASLIGAEIALYSCLVGTMVQEAYATHPAIRNACAASIVGHAELLEADIAAALLGADPKTTDVATQAASLARYTQAVLQGAFVVSKALDDPKVARDSVRHLRHYFELLLHRDQRV